VKQRTPGILLNIPRVSYQEYIQAKATNFEAELMSMNKFQSGWVFSRVAGTIGSTGRVMVLYTASAFTA